MEYHQKIIPESTNIMIISFQLHPYKHLRQIPLIHEYPKYPTFPQARPSPWPSMRNSPRQQRGATAAAASFGSSLGGQSLRSPLAAWAAADEDNLQEKV